MDISLHGGFEAVARGWRGMQDDEMEPAQIAAEVLRGDAPPAAEKILQLGVPAVDGLDVQFAAHRSPADWLSTSWETPSAAAQGG